jgi:hypothetical protein
MTRQIKFWIYFGLLILFFSLQTEFGFCEQKNQSILSSVRTGEHKDFTRIVFEFQNAVQFKNPKIKAKGKFSILFLDSFTDLPPLTVYWTDSLQKVQSVEFKVNKPNLTANVTLTFPYFMLKAFFLSDPDRVIVDAYKLSAPSKDSIHNTSFNDGVSSQVFKRTETKESKRPN